MQHPFDGILTSSSEEPAAPYGATTTRRSLLRWVLAGVAAGLGIGGRPALAGRDSTSGAGLVKTAMVGAEKRLPAPVTTQALGEEGGAKPPQVTTFALGEEGGTKPPVTTQALGEEGGRKPPATTQALGEEGGRTPPVTTQALGEEGGSKLPRSNPREGSKAPSWGRPKK